MSDVTDDRFNFYCQDNNFSQIDNDEKLSMQLFDEINSRDPIDRVPVSVYI